MKDLLPDELTDIKQWTHSFSTKEKELKRPAHTDYKPNGSLSYKEALRRAGKDKYIGFYVTLEDPYVMIDIDHVDPDYPFEDLPFGLANFIRQKKTYSEMSPSGEGLRVVLKLTDKKDKLLVNGKTFYTKEEVPKGKEKKDFQLNFGPPWMTITGNITHFAERRIAETTVKELNTLFNVKFKTTELKTGKPVISTTHLPSKQEVRDALFAIPLDQNPRVERAMQDMTEGAYSHYDFWMRVLMALHHYAELSNANLECLEYAIQWSKQDEASYTGEDDVQKHWESLESKDRQEGVTYRTLFKLALSCNIVWPVPRPQSKEERKHNIKKKPMNSEIVNYDTLLAFFNIRIHYDASNPNELYVSGDDDVLKALFKMRDTEYCFGKYYGPYDVESLSHAMFRFCQHYGFTGISYGKVKDFTVNTLKRSLRKVNFVRMYFNTPYSKLEDRFQENTWNKEHSNFDTLWECIKVIPFNKKNPTRELMQYKSYYRKWWYGFIRAIFYEGPHDMNNCVLLLTGVEQIRKTSHFRYLLPKFLRNRIAFTTHGFTNEQNLRDLVKIASQNFMLVWDEIERLLTAENEPNFKKVIDGLPQTLIDKYEVRADIYRPISIYGATSNQTELPVGDKGARRIFHIPVSWVDTDTVERLCWYPILQELRRDYNHALAEGKTPWLLTERELEVQQELLAYVRTRNSLDLIVESIYDFEAKFDRLVGVSSIQGDKSGRLKTNMDVRRDLRVYGFQEPKVKSLEHTLKRLCAYYTRTERKIIELDNPRCIITGGMAKQGPHSKYVMPPKKEDMEHAGSNFTRKEE